MACMNTKRDSLLINIKRFNLTLWKKDLLQIVAKSAEETERSRTIVSFQVTVHIFYSFPNEMDFVVCPSGNGKCPLFR